jgi:hypothetical protein
MTFLLCADADADADDVLEVVRQKGELELEGLCQRLHCTRQVSTHAEWSIGSNATVSYLAAMLCYDGCGGQVEEHEPTWTISWWDCVSSALRYILL